MADLHQPDADIESQHAGAAQLPQEAALPGRIRTLLRLGIGHPGAAQQDTGHDCHDRQRINIQTEAVEQRTEPHHRNDEADAAPQPNLTVARRLFAQVRQGDYLELRQHRVPEEGVQRHDQRQPGVAPAEEDQPERQQRAERSQAHDGQALTGRISEPAPQVRRQAAHQHGDRHQLADTFGGKAEVIEIQAEKRRGRAQQGEIEEIEAREAPVG